MKLQTLLEHFKVTSTGFPAFAALGEHSKGTDEVTLSTLPAAVLASQGITEYYAPVIPRNSKFMTTEDVLNADLDVQKHKIEHVDLKDTADYANPVKTVIVSRHQGTVEYIKKDLNWASWGDALAPKVLDGNVTVDDIKGKQVIGTLPPHLITECDVYIAISIKDFDYAKDGDLYGEELAKRIVVNDPIKLTTIKVTYLSDKECILHLTDKGSDIQFIKNPTLDMQSAALDHDLRNIKYIKNQHEEIKRRAIGTWMDKEENQCWENLEFIENPNRDLYMQAISVNSQAYTLIKNPSEEFNTFLLRVRSYMLKYIENPTMQQIRIALSDNPRLFEYIKKPDIESKRLGVRAHGGNIEYIENPSEELQLIAVNNWLPAIKWIEQPTKKVKKYVSKNDTLKDLAMYYLDVTDYEVHVIDTIVGIDLIYIPETGCAYYDGHSSGSMEIYDYEKAKRLYVFGKFIEEWHVDMINEIADSF